MSAGVLLARARRAWFPLLFVLLFGWLDWLSHRDPVVAIGVLLAVAAILRWPDIAERLGLTAVLSRIPSRVRPLLIALPGLAFVLLRGQGDPTTRTAPTVAVLSVITVAALSFFGPTIDVRLSGWYTRRNLLPRLARMALTPVLAVLLSYLIVHGAPGDITALAGMAPSSTPATGSGGPWLAALASLVTAAVGFLLLREPQAS